MIGTRAMPLLRRSSEITAPRRYPLAMASRPGRLFVVVLALAALPVAAPAARQVRTVEDSKLLWATVNVCDTPAHPNTIGIRASMPGSRDGREVMWMRFQVQYLSSVDHRWHRVRSGGDSGFVRVGPARYEARQSGRSFRFAPSSAAVLLRGVVTFEWRLKGEVVRRARRRTSRGHASTVGADPRRYSAPTCTVTA